MYAEGMKDDVYVEVAFQHNDSYNENMFTFVNNVNTPEGGTHLAGFRMAFTQVLNDYARKNGFLKDNEKNLTGEDAVSYTHLDVYKRQPLWCRRKQPITP